MDAQTIAIIATLMGLGALLYTAVGHAGASAYLAIMALFAVPAATMKPTALVLNVLVAAIATFRFARAKQLNFRLFFWFALGAIPAAFFAARLQIPGEIYRPLVGVVVLIAGMRLMLPLRDSHFDDLTPPPIWLCVLGGGCIGLLSGLTGTGGGIFLSPLIIFMRWEQPRKTSGTVVAFILCVSISGLAGAVTSTGRLPAELPYYVGAVLLGALIGTQLGISKLKSDRIINALGIVLLVAAGKLILT